MFLWLLYGLVEKVIPRLWKAVSSYYLQRLKSLIISDIASYYIDIRLFLSTRCVRCYMYDDGLGAVLLVRRLRTSVSSSFLPPWRLATIHAQKNCSKRDPTK